MPILFFLGNTQKISIPLAKYDIIFLLSLTNHLIFEFSLFQFKLVMTR